MHRNEISNHGFLAWPSSLVLAPLKEVVAHGRIDFQNGPRDIPKALKFVRPRQPAIPMIPRGIPGTPRGNLPFQEHGARGIAIDDWMEVPTKGFVSHPICSEGVRVTDDGHRLEWRPQSPRTSMSQDWRLLSARPLGDVIFPNSGMVCQKDGQGLNCQVWFTIGA